MIYRTASAPAKPVSLTLAAIARPLATTMAWSLPLAVALAIGAGSPVFAQQQEAAPPAPGAAPAPAPAAKAKPAKKAKPAAQAAPPAQAQQPARARAQPQQGQGPAPGPEQAPGVKAKAASSRCSSSIRPGPSSASRDRKPTRKPSLFHRQGRSYRVGHAGGRRGADRAGRAGAQSSARDLAARHAARSRHPRDHRPEPADDRARS